MPLKKALDELDGAMRNRDAEAGVMVFASQSECPVNEPFQWFDHRALVVLDKHDPDARAPSRLPVGALDGRREEAEGAGAVDVARCISLLDSARLSLKTVTTIKGDHKKAHNAIDQASVHLVSLVSDLSLTLGLLEDEIAGVPA